LTGFRGRGGKDEWERERMRQGWSNNGRWRRKKEEGSAFTPREVPSNFSAAIAPVRLKKV